jgi:hypothetical protein
MSHFTTVETKITDLVALELALKDLNYAFTKAEEHQFVTVKGYLGQTTEATIAIHASKTYDIGVKVGEKGVSFVADWWGVETTRGVTEKEFVQAVKQRYAYHKVMGEILKKGYSLQEEEQTEDKVIRIRVRSWE